MRRNICLGIFLIAVGLVMSDCQKKNGIKGVELSVSFSEPTLSDKLITDVEYKWKTTNDFVGFDRDYSIFVRFWHNKNNIFSDNYVPEVATTKWTKKNEYTVKRRIYIPPFIDEFDPFFKGDETLRLSAGFYDPADRAGHSALEVLSKKLKVFPPPPGTPDVIYGSGWYGLEIDPNSALKEWRWTAKEAKCIIDNSKKDALLVIRGSSGFKAAGDQRITFKINDLVLDEFVAGEEIFEKSYNIKKEKLGNKRDFILTIAVDRTWVPAKVIPNSKDERELGCRISFLYFR